MKKKIMSLSVVTCILMSFLGYSSEDELTSARRKKIHPIAYCSVLTCYALCFITPLFIPFLFVPKIQDRCDRLEEEYLIEYRQGFGNATLVPSFCNGAIGGVIAHLVLIDAVLAIVYGAVFYCVATKYGKGLWLYDKDRKKLKKMQEVLIHANKKRGPFDEITGESTINSSQDSSWGV